MIPRFASLTRRVSASLLALSFTAMAQNKSFMLSDFESGAGQNALSGYWYHFSDAGSEGNSKVTTMDSVTGYWDTSSVGQGFGGSIYSGRMGFVFGDKRPTCGVGCTFDPEVNMATDLRTGDSVQNLTGATHINFAARANTPLKVSLLVLTAGVKDHAHYRQVIDIGTGWKEYSVVLQASPLFNQPPWGARVPFDPSQVTHLHWQVTQGLNKTLLSDTLDIDDVKILGWEPVDPSAIRFNRDPSISGGLRAIGFGNQIRISLAGVSDRSGGLVRIQDLSGRKLFQSPYQAGQKTLEANLGHARQATGPYFVRIQPAR